MRQRAAVGAGGPGRPAGGRRVLEPVVSAGKVVTTVRKYSDTLLIVLLKGKRPDTYRERFAPSRSALGPFCSRARVRGVRFCI